MLLLVNKITGYTSLSPILIITKGDKPFYLRTRDAIKGNPIKFNLPAGIYDVKEGVIVPLSKPIVYPFTIKYKADYPQAEFKKLNIIVGKNPNKASVNIYDYPSHSDIEPFVIPANTAIIDPLLAAEIEPVVEFIINHEYGHNLFRGNGQESERACDAFATMIMLNKGFNPNQIVGAIEKSLSNYPDACIRKGEVYNELLKQIY